MRVTRALIFGRFSRASSGSRGTRGDHEPHGVKAMTSEWRSGRGVSERDGRSDQPRERRGTICKGCQNDCRWRVWTCWWPGHFFGPSYVLFYATSTHETDAQKETPQCADSIPQAPNL